MMSVWIGVTDTIRCLASFVVLCTIIGANAYCHLIGRDDENILSSCIDQLDDIIDLLRYITQSNNDSGCIRHTSS